MRSGSSAQDGGGWPSAQRPHSDEAPGNQGRYGSGPRSQANEGQGGRRDVPFGPEISWPYGFRQIDPESREVLESAYGTGPGYQQPAMDDYGYGDPGYSDPSYEGPKTPYGGPAFPGGPGNAAAPRAFGEAGYRQPGAGVPGYHVPDVRDTSRPGYPGPGYQPQEFAPPSGGQEIWPVTGAQEALPDTGPHPAAEARGGSPRPGNAAYPEQWYDNPRLEARALDDVRPARPADPRLDSISYGELRYDEPAPGASGHDEPLDDESWYEELRRSAPAYPQSPGGPPPGGPQGPGSGPQRRAEPRGPASGQQHGHPQAPDRAAGYGQPSWDGFVPNTPERPQMSAGRMPGPGRRQLGQPGQQLPPAPPAQSPGFLSAPVAPVGLLTPPGGTRVDALRDGGAFPGAPAASPTATPSLPASSSPRARASQALATPSASRPGTATVRPGHGLDGPEITSSWPVQPPVDLESFEDFWRDDADEEYTGLFGDREAEFERADAKQAAASKRRTGRRRGGSSDRRLWLSLGGVVVVAAAAIVGVIKFEFPSHSGPVHSMAIPGKIGSYARTVGLEQQADLPALREKVIKMSSGEASKVVSAVY